MPILRILVVAALGAPACAPCDIPVFRYALERWPAAPYEFVCFHRGPVAPETETVLGTVEKSFANAEVQRVDVSSIADKTLSELWTAQGNPALPWLVVRFPRSDARMASAWAGAPDGDALKGVLDSPARQETARRLLQGDSAVWLLIEGGEAAANDAAARLLDAELRKLEKTLKLPESDPEEGPQLLSEIPLRIAFSVLRLSRNDAAEKAFVSMLGRTGDEMAKAKGPVVLPVFGRGRALWPLSGDRLNPAEIAEAAEFLAGACSCQIKDMNPGLDLLFATDWEQGLSAPRSADPAPVSAVTSPQVTTSDPPAAPGRRPGLMWIGVAILSAGVLVAGIVLLRPRPPSGPC